MSRNKSIAVLVDGIYNAITIETPRNYFIGRGKRSLLGTETALSEVSTKEGIKNIVEPPFQDLYRNARAQSLVDWSLKAIAHILIHDLFQKQKDIRGKIEDMVVKGKEGSLPRNLLRDLLREEKKCAETIEQRKKDFDQLMSAAKECGFEVFERDENRFHLYLALEVSFWEIARDFKFNLIFPPA